MSSSSENISNSLLLGIKNGDKRAFEVFFRMEHNNLVHFLNCYLKDASTAEDIAQETFIKVWEKRNLIDSGKNLRAFTFTIAKNKALDYLRTYKPKVSIEECGALADPSLDSLVETLDLTDLIRKTFFSLPPKLRNTFLRSRVDGMRNKDIASEDGVSEKAVEYRIGAVLKSFKKILGKI